MQTNNVFFAERPEKVIVTTRGRKSLIEFPCKVEAVETEDGVQYRAETVYSLETMSRDGLKERVDANYDAWLDRAKKVTPQPATLGDVVDALNALTDLILGE